MGRWVAYLVAMVALVCPSLLRAQVTETFTQTPPQTKTSTPTRTPVACGETFTATFHSTFDYRTSNTQDFWTLAPDPSGASIFDENTTAAGKLYIRSNSSAIADKNNVFLAMQIPQCDFIATIHHDPSVNSDAVLQNHGIMIRALDAQPGKYYNAFGAGWSQDDTNVVIHYRDTPSNSGSLDHPVPITSYEYLQMRKVGSVFTLWTSSDGVSYTQATKYGSAVDWTRPELDAPAFVGIFQSVYTGTNTDAAYYDFTLELLAASTPTQTSTATQTPTFTLTA